MDDIQASKQATRERAESLPPAVWDCEACRGSETMAIRSSHLNRDVYADDIKFKCMACYHIRVHGVPFTDLEAFEHENERRPGTIVDFATDPEHQAAEQLEALGYTARADSLR